MPINDDEKKTAGPEKNGKEKQGELVVVVKTKKIKERKIASTYIRTYLLVFTTTTSSPCFSFPMPIKFVIRQYLSYYSHTWHDGRNDLCKVTVGRQRQKISVAWSWQLSIKLVTTVGHFYYVTLTMIFQTFLWLFHFTFLFILRT